MKKYYTTLLLAFAALSTQAQTDIFDAARSGNIDAAKQMMEVNADTLNSVNSQGYTPLLLSTYHNQTEFAMFLLDSGAELTQVEGEQTALHGVAYKGYPELCEVLLNAGADPNHPDANGTTPFHYAVQFNHIELVKLMLKHGAKVDLQDQTGRSAMDIASQLGHSEIVALMAK